MKIRWWHGLALNAVLAAILIIGIGAARLQGTRLRILDAYSGRRYGQWSVKDGDTFAIEFIHSVHNSPVRETFIVAGPEIRPVESRFSAAGAGMDSDTAAGREITRDGEFFIITGFTESHEALHYIVGTVSDHVLYIYNRQNKKHETISLRDLCGKNAHITIHTQKQKQKKKRIL